MNSRSLGRSIAAASVAISLGCSSTTRGSPAEQGGATGGSGGSDAGGTGGVGGYNEPQGSGTDCAALHPEGVARFGGIVSSCGCVNKGACYQACSPTGDCGPPGLEPKVDFTSACGKCILPAGSDSPCADLASGCGNDDDCFALLQCMTGKSYGGAAGAAGTGGAAGAAGTAGSEGTAASAGSAGGPHV